MYTGATAAMLQHRYGTPSSSSSSSKVFSATRDPRLSDTRTADVRTEEARDDTYGAFWHSKAKRAEIKRARADRAAARGRTVRAARLEERARQLESGLSRRKWRQQEAASYQSEQSPAHIPGMGPLAHSYIPEAPMGPGPMGGGMRGRGGHPDPRLRRIRMKIRRLKARQHDGRLGPRGRAKLARLKDRRRRIRTELGLPTRYGMYDLLGESVVEEMFGALSGAEEAAVTTAKMFKKMGRPPLPQLQSALEGGMAKSLPGGQAMVEIQGGHPLTDTQLNYIKYQARKHGVQAQTRLSKGTLGSPSSEPSWQIFFSG